MLMEVLHRQQRHQRDRENNNRENGTAKHKTVSLLGHDDLSEVRAARHQ
jgi:hypothetical protein